MIPRWIVVALAVVLAAGATAQAYDWRIDRDGDTVKMRQRFDYDPSKRYRGTIDDDGSVRMRNWDGDRLRGQIDQGGYGRLRDGDGNTWRVRPR